MAGVFLPRGFQTPMIGAVLRANAEHPLHAALDVLMLPSRPVYDARGKYHAPLTEVGTSIALNPSRNAIRLQNTAVGTGNVAVNHVNGPTIPSTRFLTIAARVLFHQLPISASSHAICCKDSEFQGRGYYFNVSTSNGSGDFLSPTLLFAQNGSAFPYSSGPSVNAYGSVVLTANRWYDVAAVRSDTFAGVYLDGVNINALASNWMADPVANTARWVINKREYGGFEDPGDMSYEYLAVFNAGLSQDALRAFQAEPYALVTR